MNEETKALFALNLVEGLGTRKTKLLLEKFGSARRVLAAEAKELAEAAGIDRVVAVRIRGAAGSAELEKELIRLGRENLRAVSILDADYPAGLKTIYDPPPVLYVKGGLPAAGTPAVAVVGTRRPSYHGMRTAEKMAYDLADAGIVVVSGMARGIDTCAHEGALRAGGCTLAVLGSGLLKVYPPENGKLAERIAAAGAVISEYPLSTPPRRENFPRRNRLLSGLSLGVVVVEAGERSGALITVDCALEQGREVLAVPGPAGAIGSRGTNRLLREGARLVENAADVIAELGLTVVRRPEKTEAADDGKPVLRAAELGTEADRIFSLLGEEPAEVDELIAVSGLSPEKVLGGLGRLEIGGLVRQLPGKRFVRKAGK